MTPRVLSGSVVRLATGGNMNEHDFVIELVERLQAAVRTAFADLQTWTMAEKESSRQASFGG